MCWSRTLLLALFCASIFAVQADLKTKIATSASGLVTTLEVQGLVRHRYATIQLTSLLANPQDHPVEANFTLHVPENAFISYATLEVDGEVIRGQVQERKVAQEQYQLAASTGATASQVSAVRDASEVKILVQIGAKSRAIFNLTYEEFLVRRKGRYELAINVDPQQELERLKIEIAIKESKNITFVNVPPFSSTVRPDDLDNSIKNEDVKIDFTPDEDHATISYLKEKTGDGPGVRLPGPLVVRYDVARESKAGEILLLDGYFVHFMSSELEKSAASYLPKHAIFVLDSSASMWGSKLDQLKIAMSQILRQLRKQDVFSIVTFGNRASEWTLQGLQPSAGKGVYAANRRNIALAMDFVSRMQATGGTNIQHALRRALYLSARLRNMTLISGVSEGSNYTTPKPSPEKDIQPVIMFLTDGVPTAGEVRLTKLLKSIQFANQNTNASIFALALGPSANYGFLRRLALLNHGFSRRIYESSDTSLQLQSFYQEISSPILTNVTFTYVDQKVNFSSLTSRIFPILFSGSEVVVAGKLADGIEGEDDDDFGVFSAKGIDGDKVVANFTLPPGAVIVGNQTYVPKKRRIGVLEKIWAHLTIRQLLDNSMIEDAGELENESGEDSAEKMEKTRSSELKDRALALALKYGFVTPLTSLVMVSQKKNITLIEKGDDIEKEIQQSELEVSNNKVGPFLPSNIQQAALNKPPITPEPEISTPATFAAFEWLSTLLAENDSITFIKTNGEEVTRVVSKTSDEENAKKVYCSWATEKKEEASGFCKSLLECPSEQVPTFDEYLRRFCDYDGVSLGVCCES